MCVSMCVCVQTHLYMGMLAERATPVISTLGQTMAQFPVAPRYARMLAATKKTDLLPYVIIAVAALSVDELFVDFQNGNKEVRQGESVGE